MRKGRWSCPNGRLFWPNLVAINADMELAELAAPSAPLLERRARARLAERQAVPARTRRRRRAWERP